MFNNPLLLQELSEQRIADLRRESGAQRDPEGIRQAGRRISRPLLRLRHH